MEERDGPEPTPAGQVQGVENVVEALLEDEEGGDRKADQRRDDAADFHGSLVLPLDCFWRRLMRVAVAATIASRKRLRGRALEAGAGAASPDRTRSCAAHSRRGRCRRACAG